MSVGMYQFIKGERVANFGEQVAARRLGVEITQLGAGCIAWRKDLEGDRALAESGWEKCRTMILNGEYDILILDELTNVLRRGWLDLCNIVETLKARPAGTHVVITGRSAPQELIDAADLVTEMRVIKHPLREQGVRAQAGIDV
jgi:cob(I)alamin adenosyltransferase